MLKIFDKNNKYWIEFSKVDWWNGKTLEKVICVESIGTYELKEDEKIPDEFQIMISLEDAEYLYAFLTVVLKK